MSIQWVDLNARTNGFASMVTQKDPSGTIDSITAVGLHLTLSDIMATAGGPTNSSLTIYADTLVVNTASLPGSGIVIVARNMDLSLMPGGSGPLTIATPTSGGVTAVEILVGQVTGGPLELTTGAGQVYTVPSGLHPLQAALVTVDPTGQLSGNVRASDADIGDLVGRVFALNSLQASFGAATWLMLTDDAGARSTAQSMVAWTVACTGPAARTTAVNPAAWTDLHNQALPLLIQLNVETGATYVPALSSAYYQREVSVLFDALDSYDTKIASLKGAADLGAAVAQIGSTLTAVTQTELGPLDAEITNLSDNLTALTVGINTLNLQFDLQASSLNAKWADVEVALTDQQIKAWFNACFKLSIQAIELGNSALSLASSVKSAAPNPVADEAPQWNENPIYDGGGDDNWIVNALYEGGDDDGDGGDGGGGVGNEGDSAAKPKPGAGIGETKKVVTGAVTLAKTAIDAIIAVSKDAGAAQRPLLDKALALVDLQSKLLQDFVVSTGLAPALGVSDALEPFTIDPALVWDNYMAEATMQMSRLTVGAADSYLAALQILANYGKAMAAKVATAASQRSRLLAVQSQRAATLAAGARWSELEAAAKTDEEKAAGLMGVLANRTDSIKRSVFGAWQKYRDSYYYLYFAQPPVTVNLDMDTAALRAALANVSMWVADLTAADGSANAIRLPNEDVKISFAFDVVHDASSEASINQALYSPTTGDMVSTLTWVIPMGTDQLVGVLPDRGLVAIWIKDASFTIEGVTPNDKGNVITQIWTSGTYENGFGPAQSHTFVSKPMVSNYAYRFNDSSTYVPWKVNDAATMVPTPFTQWTIGFYTHGGDAAQATRLKVDLTVSYRKASS